MPRAGSGAAPGLRARGAAPPGGGKPARLVCATGSADALPGARGRGAVLALLARRRLALDPAQRARAGRGDCAPAGDPPAPRGRLGGRHRRALGRPTAVRRLERTLRGRVATVRRRAPGRRCGRRAHAPGVLGRPGLARQPAGAGDRPSALVALRPAGGDVRAPARPVRDRPGRRSGPRRPPRRRARNPRPCGQRHPSGVPPRPGQPAHCGP